MNNIKLWDKTPFFDENINQPEPFLKPYIKDGAKSAVIVCPGGAYRDLAEHEGHPVALWLNSIGITAFVLTYRLAPYTEKAITGDILRAVRVVRSNAENFGIEKTKSAFWAFPQADIWRLPRRCIFRILFSRKQMTPITKARAPMRQYFATP